VGTQSLGSKDVKVYDCQVASFSLDDVTGSFCRIL